MSAQKLVGQVFGPSEWLEVTQERIDAFAAATDDPQWIHVDPARAVDGPFGTTVAHGFMTLSLCVPFLFKTLPLEGYRLVVNYGVDRVRFPAPVPSGSRIRASFSVTSVEETAQGERVSIRATVECDGSERPVCVAHLVLLLAT